AVACAQSGSWGGQATEGLVAPGLADVQRRLQERTAPEGAALRLERYVNGSGAWLFGRSDPGLAPSDGENVAYVLAGLPEEERAAAMFLVLDRIWTGLSAASRPTLVVVDEAWWLMRHRDTASFLFRLVTTGRKRR